MPRLRLAAAALSTALTALALAGCGDGDPSTIETPAPTATSPAPASAAPTSAAPTSTLPAGVDRLVRVTVRNGEVVGGAPRVKVALNEVVRLVVTSDAADEVHLHTYDEKADVAAGGTAQLTFTADIPGVIKAELEGAGLTLVSFQIQ